MIIVGGAYAEYTDRPQDARLRGSGLRAAIALRSLTHVQLYTLVAASEQEELEATAAAFNLDELHVVRRTASVAFSYFTPLSPPAIEGRGSAARERILGSGQCRALLRPA